MNPQDEPIIHDWRGTPIVVGCHVLYHTNQRKTVEGVVINVTGDVGRNGYPEGVTVLIQPLWDAHMCIARQPHSSPRLGVAARKVAVDHHHVTVVPEILSVLRDAHIF